MAEQRKSHALELKAQENEIKLQTKEEYGKEIEKLKEQLRRAEDRESSLKAELAGAKDKKKIAVVEAVRKVEDEKRNLENEMDTTATKHKNEDFFKELDKDRKEKKCEYAVRPQCFIPIITLLRNAAMNALTYKQELAAVRNQDIDISNFENNLMMFKEDFSRNYNLAHAHFDKAIDEINKTIQHLEKVKKELLGSDNQLHIANNKVDEVSVKKLTQNNPTMQAKFDELKSKE